MDEKPAFIYRDGMTADKEYVSWLHDLKERYLHSQVRTVIHAQNEMLTYYWSLGRDIVKKKAESKWGSGFFNQLSLDMKAMFPGDSGFSVTNLKYMKRWYAFYNDGVAIRHQAGDGIGILQGDEHDTVIRQQFVDEFSVAIHQQAVDELEMPDTFAFGNPVALFNVSYLTAFSVVVKDEEEVDLSQACHELASSLSQQSKSLILSLKNRKMTASELQLASELASSLSPKSKFVFKKYYIYPNIEAGLLARTYHNNPRHPQQKYYLTELGLAVLAELTKQQEMKN